MAITSTHGELTVSVLMELGFSKEAAMIAADANEKVDERQSSDARETNLHAMRGYIVVDGAPTRIMQTEDQARKVVEALLQSAQSNILQSVRGGNFKLALEQLGAALHTVQDKEYHRFEPWPFESLVDAVTNFKKGLGHGLDPNYMLCHGLRDLSYISGLEFGARYHTGPGWSTHVRVEGTLPSSNPWLPHLSAGVVYNYGVGGSGQELAGYALFTWGATPGSQEPRLASPRVPGGIPVFERGPQFCREASQGPGSLLAARRESLEFTKAIQKILTDEEWRSFKAYPQPG